MTSSCLQEPYGFGPHGLTYSHEPSDSHETVCGLCEKYGATLFWRTDKSHVVHPLCLSELKSYLDLIEQKINKYFPLDSQVRLKLEAQVQALTALRPYLDGKSIIVFKNERSDELIALIERVAFFTIEMLYVKNKIFS